MQRFATTLLPAALVGLVCSCGLGSDAQARDIFVDNEIGDNIYRGELPSPEAGRGPVRTIGRALDLASASDRIILANNDTPYRESISLFGSRHSGVPNHPFRIQGNGATLEGLSEVPPTVWTHRRDNVFAFWPRRLGHQVLYRDGRPLQRADLDPAAGAAPTQLEPLQWTLFEGRLYLRAEKNQRPQDYQLQFATREVGVSLYSVRNVEIVDLVIQGFQKDGVHVVNSVQEAVLSGVTSRGNGRAGVLIGGASRIVLNDCLVGDNGTAQLLTRPRSETYLRNCEVLSNTAPVWVDEGGELFVVED